MSGLAAFPKMLEQDRRRRGLTVGQVAWRLGVKPHEYREPRGRQAFAGLRDMGPDLQAERVATDVARFLEVCGRLFAARSWFEHYTAALERIRATA